MRYLGGGIGHQNQDARWKSSKEGGNEDNNVDMDVDAPCEENTNMDEDPVDENQLRELAIKLSSRPADDDDEDIDSDENSSDGSSEDETSDEDERSNDDDLFIDNEGNENQEEPNLGPDDEEQDDDTGFGSF